MGNEEIVKLLLEHGAERARATQSKYKLVPLYFAAWGEHASCIQALISNAPSPDQVRIEVNLAAQKATLYRDGSPVYNTDISSGRKGYSTPTGQFVVTDKKTSHMSSIYKVKMPFFMRLSCRDFGMHEGQVPNYPASHGCIRLPGDAARRLFKEVPIGTLVTITN
jgi:lipoprotein-anchoring transpeptidase ErfK/SrfK